MTAVTSAAMGVRAKFEVFPHGSGWCAHAFAVVSAQSHGKRGSVMAGLDRDQLEALRRQIEEDYRLDIAAIDRLQRRFIPSPAGASSGSNGALAERNIMVLPSLEPQAEAQPDELTNTLRGMFSSHRK